jgi:hypothetical protein
MQREIAEEDFLNGLITLLTVLLSLKSPSKTSNYYTTGIKTEKEGEKEGILAALADGRKREWTSLAHCNLQLKVSGLIDLFLFQSPFPSPSP